MPDPVPVPGTAAFANVAEVLVTYGAGLDPTTQSQLRASQACLVKLLYHLHPRLPNPAEGPALGPAWLATVPVEVLDDTKVLLAALDSKTVRTHLGYSLASWRAFRHRLKPFFTWWHQRQPAAAPLEALSPQWRALIDRLEQQAPKTKRRLWCAALGQLARYALAAGLTPTQVDLHLLECFRAYLLNDSGLAEAKRYYREAEKAWDLLAGEGRVHPLAFPKSVPKPVPYVLKRVALPPHFAAVVDDLKRRMRSTNPEDWRVPMPPDPAAPPVAVGPHTRRDRPLANATIANKLRVLLAFLGYLVHIRRLDLETLTFPELFGDAQWLFDFGEFLRLQDDPTAGAAAAETWKPAVWHLKWLAELAFLAETYIPRRWPEVTVDLSALRTQLAFTKGRRTDKPKHIPLEQVEQVLTWMERQAEEWGKRCHPIAPAYRLSLLRDRLALTFLAETGLRAGNVRTAELGQQVHPDPHGYTCQFFTKNRRQILLSMSPRVVRILVDYLELRQQMGLTAPYLLITQRNTPLSHQQLWQQVAKWFKKVLHISYSPHDFRRSLASDVLQQTGDMDLAKILLFDSSAQVIDEAYNVTSADQAFADYHQQLRAIEQRLPQAASPPVRQLLALAADPHFHHHLTILMAAVEAQYPTPNPGA